MPVYTRAWIADTRHLHPSAQGIYWTLCLSMWERRGYLPTDRATLQRIANADNRTWSKHGPGVIAEFFVEVEVDGRQALTSPKLLETFAEALRRSRLQGDRRRGKGKHQRAAAAQQSLDLGPYGRDTVHRTRRTERRDPEPSEPPKPLKNIDPEETAVFPGKDGGKTIQNPESIDGVCVSAARVRARGQITILDDLDEQLPDHLRGRWRAEDDAAELLQIMATGLDVVTVAAVIIAESERFDVPAQRLRAFRAALDRARARAEQPPDPPKQPNGDRHGRKDQGGGGRSRGRKGSVFDTEANGGG